ncbi:glycosyltransferase family 4 protein [Vibrio parahaemolyticus]|nr:glycosyltransferase family 4 protein [Vibrio parahaemolyticus]
MTSQNKKTLIFDPIAFKGGSKIATSDALNVCRVESNDFIVATVDTAFWKQTEFYAKHNVTLISISPVPWLMSQHNGILYWLNQLYFLLVLLKTLIEHRGITTFIGASGPGMDMPVYLLQMVLNIEVVQFIHGNVGLSRSIGFCLTRANAVFYLTSTRCSLKAALETYLKTATKIKDTAAMAESYLNSSQYQSFVNGIPASRWPQECQKNTPIYFWAASLLKWKGLETLIKASKRAAISQSVVLNVCYIRPVDTCLPISNAPVLLSHTRWYEDPENLDDIRSQSNIFVSTSCNEPFGLSILEALAAGMCVVIPRDGAYWDKTLTHNENCIKYQPGNPDSLCDALLCASNDQQTFHRCSQHALEIATRYKAEHCYQKFAKHINGDVVTSALHACN